MKYGVLVFVLALAACGGGGGSSGGGAPIPQPTNSPIATSVRVHFVGGVVGGNILKDAVRFTRSTTNDNVELASPDATPDPNGAWSLSTDESTGATDGIIQVVSSPAPSGTPVVTDSSTTATVVPTPAPSPGATPVTTIPTVRVYEHTPNVTESKVITVTSGGTTTTTNQWVYRTATVTCNGSNMKTIAAEDQRGLTFDASGNTQPANDPTVADLYLTGQVCPGVFQDSGPYTLHVPGGAKVYAGTQPFDTLNPADWSNVTTAINLYDFNSGFGVFQFKTRSGLTVKVLPGSSSENTLAGFGFEYAVSGKSPDGY